MARGVIRPAAGIALAWWGLGADVAHAQSCAPTGTNQTCTNSTLLPNATSAGITDSGTLTLTNTASGVVGTVTASGHDGIDAIALAKITNLGSITGYRAVNAGSANVTNAGTIAGAQFGVFTVGDATVSNSGTISSFSTSPGVAGVLSDSGSLTVTNSGHITGGEFGVAAFMNVTVVNSGTLIGQTYGVFSDQSNVTLTNSGTVASSSTGVAGVLSVGGNATITNSGSIAGGQYGIAAFASSALVTLTNSGSISGREVGVLNPNGLSVITNIGTISSGDVGIVSRSLMLSNAGTITGQFTGVSFQNGTVTNGGVISGSQTGVQAVGAASVNNFGVISSPNLALQLIGNGSTLTLSPGSTIVGSLELDGTGDAIHVNAPNQNLTFNTLAGTSVDGAVPYVVVGNRIASIDPTQFAIGDRNLLAVIDTVAGTLGSQTASPVSSGGGALGFNGPNYTAATAEEAFADLFGYAKAPNDAVVFKNPSVTFGDGSMVWAKGFIGQRVQEADGLVLRNVTNFYGGMVGVDGWLAPDLKLGGFAGAGHTATSIDLNAGSAASDLGFGGVYGRKELGRAFVDFDIMGGGSSNRTVRNINNNLVAGGIETATASFGGWFVSPEIAAGYRHEVWPGFTLTPAARLRYLAAGFDGYTENGSTANLTVGSRLAQALEERVEATLTHVNDLDAWGRLRLAATIGLVGQERVGSTALNAILLGQALAFATPGRSAIGGLSLSGNADWKTPCGATLFAGADYTAYSDSSTIITGRAGVRVGF